MLAAVRRCGAAMLDRTAQKSGPVSPTKPPPRAAGSSSSSGVDGGGKRKRRTSVLAAGSKRRRRATAVGRPGVKKVRFADLAVASVPSSALAGAPHPAEQILASGTSDGAQADELRCAVIRFCLASALHPGDSSGAFGQRCVPAAAVYLDMIASPTSYEACYADMSLVSVLTHALADAFLAFSEEAARRAAALTAREDPLCESELRGLSACRFLQRFFRSSAVLALATGEGATSSIDRTAGIWSQVRKHASALQKSLGIRLAVSLDTCAFAGAATSAGGLAMLANVPQLLRHCSELAESLEARSEHAPENEIYDNFSRPLKAEISAHFMQMCLMNGVDAFDDDDTDFAEEYTPLDDYEEKAEEEDDGAFDDNVVDNGDGGSGFAGDVDLSSEEGEHEVGEDQDGDYDQGDEEEAEGSLELSLLPERISTMTTKEMRLVLIDQIYSEAQLRMLVEGCAIVDGIPPAGTLAASAAAASAPEGSKAKVGLQAALRVAFANLLPKSLPPLPVPV